MPTAMADYYSIVAKAVGALDLNTEKARRRLYDRARAALLSEMHSAYPRFHRSEIAAAKMALEMAIEDALQVGEQHLDLFAIATRLCVVIGFGACSGDIASLFVDASRDFTRGLLRAAERAASVLTFSHRGPPVHSC
jgi:hypothetical protein